MKRIFLLYMAGLLTSAFIGGVVSLAFHYHWLCYILLIPLLLLGWGIMFDIFQRMNEKNLGKVTVLTAISFLVMMCLMMIAAYYQIDEQSIWGMIYAVGVVSYTIGIVIIALALPKRWEDKKRKENRYLY